MTQPSIFDRLRSMQTEGLPLHTLIVEACEVGNELVAALQRAHDHVLKDAGNWFEDNSFEQKAMRQEAHHALAALARAFPDDSNGSNGSNRSAA